MKKNIISCCFLIIIMFCPLNSQSVVFSDNFNTSHGSTFTTSGTIGSSDWTVSRSGDDWGARIHNNILELTNDATTGTSNSNGWVYAYVSTSIFSSPFQKKLKNNTGKVNYIFNMRQIRNNPAGFISGYYGVAFIIGSTSNTIATAGNGYAIVLGNVDEPDPIRFVKFTGGIQTLGTSTGGLITAGSPLNNPTNNYMSIAISYNPSNDEWTLYGRNDGSTTFGDPSDGNLTLLGSVIDNTYTNTDLDYLGTYWQGSTSAGQTAFFDNVSVKIGDIVLPIELNYFYAKVSTNNEIILNWSTATEINNYGFEVERSVRRISGSLSKWEKIGFVEGAGNRNSPKDYVFEDKVPIAGIVKYRLKQIDYDGSYSYSNEVEVEIKSPKEYVVEQNYPNPFNPSTKISYTLPDLSKVRLELYDLTGRLVKVLIDELKESGFYEYDLNALNLGLTTGIYFYRFVARSEKGNIYNKVNKMVYLR